MPNFYINTDKKLLNISDDLLQSRSLGVDTEFIRESTYFPKLALLQIATANYNYCIDVINITDKNSLSDIQVMHDFNYIIPPEKREEFWANECDLHPTNSTCKTYEV